MKRPRCSEPVPDPTALVRGGLATATDDVAGLTEALLPRIDHGWVCC
jgi:hypothetical protein